MKAGSGCNIILKRGAYYFRRRVPLDLVESLGPGEVTKPLGTKVKREAVRLARAYGARLDVGYSMVRAGQVDSVVLADPAQELHPAAVDGSVPVQRHQFLPQL